MTYTAAKQAGCDVTLIDMKSLSNYAELIKSLAGYDLVAFGLKSASYRIGEEVIKAAKEVGAKVLVGGIHTAACPSDLVDNPDIDYVYYGESEITFPKFLKNPDDYGREIRGEKPENLDDLPFMDRSIFREAVEDACGWCGHTTLVSAIAARGCQFNCAFCMPAEKVHFGKKVRRRSVDNFIEELLQLKETYNPEMLIIYDDTFLHQPPWIEEFIEKYPKVGIPFFASARADGICRFPHLLKGLIDVGLELLSVGFESGSQRVLDILEKGTTVEQNYEAARYAREYNVRAIYGNYMLGIPTETKDEVRATVAMAKTIDAELNSWAFFSPYAGNKLGDKCINEGLSLMNRHEQHRYPNAPKIKGVDYDFLHNAIAGKV